MDTSIQGTQHLVLEKKVHINFVSATSIEGIHLFWVPEDTSALKT